MATLTMQPMISNKIARVNMMVKVSRAREVQSTVKAADRADALLKMDANCFYIHQFLLPVSIK